MTYLLALDQGTTSSRAIVFDEWGNPCSTAQREVQLSTPRPAWVEQDALTMWLSLIHISEPTRPY